MINRLHADIWVSPSTGFCGFDSVGHCFNELNSPSDPWTAGDIRAALGQMYIKHQEALLAFMFKYNEMGRAKKKELVKELRCRVDQHKTSFPDTGFLQRPFWINDIDLKCLAIDRGVNIFVVSTEQITVTVIKYLFSVSAPAGGWGGWGGGMRRGGCLGAGRDLGRMLTAGQALARLQSCAPSPVSCLAFASACVGLVLSRCVALMS